MDVSPKRPLRATGPDHPTRTAASTRNRTTPPITDLTRTVQSLADYVRQLEQDVDRLSVQAWDSVAEVPVRAAWEAIVDARLRSQPTHTDIVFLDLDHFKEINDSYGHLAGDTVLREVARRLERSLADRYPMITRLGGDEFGAVALDVSPADITRITATVRQPVALPQGPEIQVTASMGLARGRDVPHATREELLRIADAQLYLDKAAHREANRPSIRAIR